MASLPSNWRDLASQCEARSDWEGARAWYEAAQRAQPARLDYNLAVQELRCAINQCRWDRHAYLQTLLVNGVRHRGAFVAGETVLASPGFGARDLGLCERRLADAIWRGGASGRAALGQAIQAGGVVLAGAPAHSGRESRPLRIGFLGGDFTMQATTYLMVGFIEARDRDRFSYTAYNYGNVDTDSALGKRVRAAFDDFHDVGMLSNQDVAARIAADGIDILLFLKGPYDPRAGILALRPAPVQLAYLYYPGGFGLPLVDGLIADEIVAPADTLDTYGEPVIHLSRCYQPNDSRRPLPQPISRRDAGLPDGAVVLANFAQPYKITPAAFDVWCDLLRAHPRCVLWLLASERGTMENLAREALLRGIDPARLYFAPPVDSAIHISRIACADLILDTWPYGGHTGTSDALWAGVPVVARSGEIFAARVAASLLHAVDLIELVAEDDEGYRRIAGKLIEDGTRREQLREHLRRGRETFPLFDSTGYARDFEAMLERLAERGVRACAARPTRPAWVEDAQPWFELGVAQACWGREPEARACYRAAVELDPRAPIPHYNLALLLKHTAPDEAEAHFRAAVRSAPDFSFAWNGLGLLLYGERRYAEAEECYRRALAADAGNLQARVNLGISLLMDGRYAEAWPYYEARHEERAPGTGIDTSAVMRPRFDFPQWNGEALDGRGVLVWLEQGLGDVMQFIRFVPLLRGLGAGRVTVACWPELADLLEASIEGVDWLRLDPAKPDVPRHDCWCFLTSLPFFLGTTLETLPNRLPYLRVPAGRTWRSRLPDAPLRVGLVWGAGQRGASPANERSMPLAACTPFLSLPGVAFVSLQLGPARGELDDLPEASRPFDPMADVRDMADTASLIAGLDLVVSVDTSVAHLAGALGKPVWVMLRHAADWRWMDGRDDTPWYPGVARLFRQPAPGDWAAVAMAVRGALEGVDL